MLGKNANGYIDDNRGETPLCRAIFWGCYDLIQILLQKGDDSTNATAQGVTVLYYTTQYGNVKAASILYLVNLEISTLMQVLEQRLVVAKEGFVRLVRDCWKVLGSASF